MFPDERQEDPSIEEDYLCKKKGTQVLRRNVGCRQDQAGVIRIHIIFFSLCLYARVCVCLHLAEGDSGDLRSGRH